MSAVLGRSGVDAAKVVRLWDEIDYNGLNLGVFKTKLTLNLVE